MRRRLVLILVAALSVLLGLGQFTGEAAPAAPAGGFANFHLPVGLAALAVYTPPLQFPCCVAISPAGVIAVTDAIGDRAIEVHADGTLSTFAAPSSQRHAGVAFDASGNFYVVDIGGNLWKVPTVGAPVLLATGINPGALDVAPSGDLYATGFSASTVQRITSGGTVSVLASGFSGAGDVAVNPVDGEVYVADWPAGTIYHVAANGTKTPLTTGLNTDNHYLAFAGDGALYHANLPVGLSTINTTTGVRTPLAWANSALGLALPKDIAVDGSGRIVAVDHTFNHVLRFDPGGQSVTVLHQGTGNTPALAVSPASAVYLGVSSPLSNGVGSVARLLPGGVLTTVAAGFLPEVDALTFDAAGLAYVAAMLPAPGGYASRIYTMTTTGLTNTVTTLPYVAHSLDVDPNTGFLWGTGYKELWYIDGGGVRHTLPFTLSTDADDILAFTPNGDLYVHTNTSDGNTAPVARGVYAVHPAGPITYTLLADLSTINVCCVQGRLGAGSDGNLYWVGFGDRHTPGQAAFMHLLRITPGGQVTLLGYDLPVDPAAITGDPNNSDLYFSSAGGVFRLFEAEMLFVPLAVR
ncbi:MAG: hypothetical protein IT317_00840 [Anaerolineales bacterium]|nr:hypothetical protein [Anaerolineales bacterium]